MAFVLLIWDDRKLVAYAMARSLWYRHRDSVQTENSSIKDKTKQNREETGQKSRGIV